MRIRILSVLLIFTAAIAAQTHSVTLTWQDALNPTGTNYSVYRATGLCSGTPTFAKVATAVTVTMSYLTMTWSDDGGKEGTGAPAVFEGADSTPFATAVTS